MWRHFYKVIFGAKATSKTMTTTATSVTTTTTTKTTAPTQWAQWKALYSGVGKIMSEQKEHYSPLGEVSMYGFNFFTTYLHITPFLSNPVSVKLETSRTMILLPMVSVLWSELCILKFNNFFIFQHFFRQPQYQKSKAFKIQSLKEPSLKKRKRKIKYRQIYRPELTGQGLLRHRRPGTGGPPSASRSTVTWETLSCLTLWRRTGDVTITTTTQWRLTGDVTITTTVDVIHLNETDLPDFRQRFANDMF